MKRRLAIRLNFEIFQDDDGWTARCEELGISTCTPDSSELEHMAEAMIRDYLESCAHIGILKEVLLRIAEGTPPPLPETLAAVPPLDLIAKYVREKRQRL